MKQIINTFSIVSILFLTLMSVSAQVNTSIETKIVDVLAQLPTEDTTHSDRLMQEVIQLGEIGILEFTSRLVPAGQGNDVQARYLVNSLAVYAGRGNSIEVNNLVESTYRKAIEEEQDAEVKTFLISRLVFCGTESSIEFLSRFLEDEEQYEAALAVLETIGTDKAAAAVFNKLDSVEGEQQYAFIESLGNMKYVPANEKLISMSDTPDWVSVKYVLKALSEIAEEDSYKTLVKAAETGKYRKDTKEGVISLINYGHRLRDKGNAELSEKVANNLLKNCVSEDQLHFRLAGLEMLRGTDLNSLNKTLLREASNKDLAYLGAVLDLADETVIDTEFKDWIKHFNKAQKESKPQLVRVIGKRNNEDVFDKCLEPSVKDQDQALRIAAIKALVYQEKGPSLELLTQKLTQKNTAQELAAIEETLLRIVNSEDALSLVDQLSVVNEEGKGVLIEVMAQRNVKESFESINALLGTGSDALDLSIYKAMGSVATFAELPAMLKLLDKEDSIDEIAALQQSVIKVIDDSESNQQILVLDGYKQAQQPSNWLPVMATIQGEDALTEVQKVVMEGSDEEKLLAISALADWRNKGSIPVLFSSATSNQSEKVRSEAFKAYLMQVVGSDHPNDQKLLLIRKIHPYSKNSEEEKMIIRAAGTVPTFLSLVFVSEFLDQDALRDTASNTAIRIALPTPTFEGLSGKVVRDIVSKSVDNLTGQDSQYLKIDVKEFLDNMSNEKGYLPIFNGKDFTGWHGLVEDPIKRSKMSASHLSKKQKQADAELINDWKVEQGKIKFIGEGFKNICTVKKYGDFDMLVDWKIGEGGDSGIYLRGSPQVQIWDTALTEVGAQVGSGGLYNNETYPSSPLVVADNPVNEWNTFRIRIEGDKVSVHLNGILVVDNVTMENYWDRNQGLIPKEAIELQAHGEDVEFRNIYVREIGGAAVELSAEEKAEGFISLFNGKDLDRWQGNKKDFQAANGELLVRPSQGERGNLYSNEEYSDFVFRFEFQLTPGANNGLGIHTPLTGDAAYVGKELQILDNTADIYANLEEYQYHGSIYGVIAAKRGFLNPVGEWNSQEVIVKGDNFKITLNGVVILDGNVVEASKNGTRDGKDHPGLKRNKGYIAFLGHASELKFRNIRLKDLSTK